MADPQSVDDRLILAARDGNVATLSSLLDRHPERLHITVPPYGGTLLHSAAPHLEVVDLPLKRGMDPNAREEGDNTYAMHWAAAAGRLDVVRRLADAGGDVIGDGDDHQLGVIGWATCWPGCEDEAHRAVADFLVSRGANHHIFSAIALNLEGEVRRIVAETPAALNQRMSRNEAHQTPLHFSVGMDRPDMVTLLMELGADPLAVDSAGFGVAMYARTSDVDLPVMRRIHAMTRDELTSADRGRRPPQVRDIDLIAALALGQFNAASRILEAGEALLDTDGHASGVMHVMAKRGDARAVKWLLDRGADPNAMWGHWDAKLPPIHLAAAQGHAGVVRVLLAAGADPSIHDTKHDGDAIGWAEYGSNPQAPNWREIVQIISESRRGQPMKG